MKTFLKNKTASKAILAIFLGLGLLAGAHFAASVSAVKSEFDAHAIERESADSRRAIGETKTPEDLDQWIARRENEVAKQLAPRGLSIKDTQSARIQWAERPDGDIVKTPISIVYVHGFSAGPLELEPTLSRIARKLGAHVFSVRLKAHALSDESGISSGEEFANLRARDWALDVEEAVAIGRRLGERTIYIGLSTGASLLLEHFARHGGARHGGEKPQEALVLLSPNYEPQAFGTFLLEGVGGAFFARRVLGDYNEFKTVNDLHRDRWTWRYRVEGLVPMMQVVARVRSTDLRGITLPVLTVYTPHDDVVRIDKIIERSKEFSGDSRTVRWESGRFHQMASAAFDAEKIEELSDLIVDWIQSVFD